MYEQLKTYHNKPDQTDTEAPPEFETKEIVALDEIYTDKDKGGTIC